MRRLIVNADDFGRSRSINQAVICAHREGILTSASLMVNEEAFEEAVALAREHPRFGVGLHLTLVCGRSALRHNEIPGLVDRSNCFPNGPVMTGLRYSLQKGLASQLEREIGAQIDRFKATGLPMDHLNGHLNIHLHPTVFGILCRNAGRWGIRAVRVTRDSFRLSCVTGRGRWGYRISHALIFACLSWVARRRVNRLGLRTTERVFGLLENGRVTTDYLMKLLARLPAGDSELYSHPSVDEAKRELDALIDPRVRTLVRDRKIRLIRYQDL